MSKTRLTITLDAGIVEKLPHRNKSFAINQIIKQHFQAEAVDQLFKTIKQQLIRDHEFTSHIRSEAGQVLHDRD